MRTLATLLALVSLGAGTIAAQAQLVVPPVGGATTLRVIPLPVPAGSQPDADFLKVFSDCAVHGPATNPLGTFPASALVAWTQGSQVAVDISPALVAGQTVCVFEYYSASQTAHSSVTSGLVTVLAPGQQTYQDLCNFAYNDCDWEYSVVGGVEQSDLSSQDSQTDPFVDLIVRAPVNIRAGDVWLRARFLGAPTNSSTQNVVAAATNPTTTVTSSSLSTVGYAIDYVVGYEYDFFKPDNNHPTRGMFTLGLIGGFGATTPLSAQNATTAYAVPAYGTNECTELTARFQATKNIAVPGQAGGYYPALPGPGSITTTTTVGTAAPTSTTSSTYCSVQTIPTTTTTTTNGTTTTVTASGTQITDVAFSPEDRSSFLLKYIAGLRLISRWHDGASQRCSSRGPADHPYDTLANGTCSRSIVDFTVGQDQAITGGLLRGFVFKSDAIFPIPKTGMYFFASAANRLKRNTDLPPLILNSVPIANGSASAAGAVTIPSPSVFVLPLKQSNRDFYRIGIALDLSKILPKLFAAAQ